MYTCLNAILHTPYEKYRSLNYIIPVLFLVLAVASSRLIHMLVLKALSGVSLSTSLSQLKFEGVQASAWFGL